MIMMMIIIIMIVILILNFVAKAALCTDHAITTWTCVAINATMVRCAAAGWLGVNGILTVPAAQAAHFNINEDSAERSDIQILK